MKILKYLFDTFNNDEKYLEQFNNEIKNLEYEFYINKDYYEEFNVLVIGNSISYHPESSKIGWNSSVGGGITTIMECVQVL